MTGLMDKQFGQVNYEHEKSSEYYELNGINGLYNYSADRINSGFGINFSQNQLTWSNNTRIGVSYQYTFNISETFKLAVGTSLNYGKQNIRGIYQEVLGFNERDYLKLNFGTAIKWKELNAGISFGRFDLISHENQGLPPQNPTASIFRRLGLHVWYNFKIGDDFILSPSISSNEYDLALRGEHFNRFWWNLGYGFEDYISIGAGINVFDEIHVGYTVNFNFIKSASLYHNISLTYRLIK